MNAWTEINGEVFYVVDGMTSKGIRSSNMCDQVKIFVVVAVVFAVNVALVVVHVILFYFVTEMITNYKRTNEWIRNEKSTQT